MRLQDLQGNAAGAGFIGHRVQLMLRRRHIPQYREPFQVGQHLDQKLQPLLRKIGKVEEHAGEIAARPRDAFHEPVLDGVGFEIERDDRNRLGGFLCLLDDRMPGHEQHLDVARHELADDRLELVLTRFGGLHDRDDVAAFLEAPRTKPFLKCLRPHCASRRNPFIGKSDLDRLACGLCGGPIEAQQGQPEGTGKKSATAQQHLRPVEALVPLSIA